MEKAWFVFELGRYWRALVWRFAITVFHALKEFEYGKSKIEEIKIDPIEPVAGPSKTQLVSALIP